MGSPRPDLRLETARDCAARTAPAARRARPALGSWPPGPIQTDCRLFNMSLRPPSRKWRMRRGVGLEDYYWLSLASLQSRLESGQCLRKVSSDPGYWRGQGNRDAHFVLSD
jgi:hypothetical protein